MPVYPARKIVQRYADGTIKKIYDSIKAAAVDNGLKYRRLSCHLGRKYYNIYHGYFWEYFDKMGMSRQCLGMDCNKWFMSQSLHNRFCPDCQNKDRGRTIYRVMAHSLTNKRDRQ